MAFQFYFGLVEDNAFFWSFFALQDAFAGRESEHVFLLISDLLFNWYQIPGSVDIRSLIVLAQRRLSSRNVSIILGMLHKYLLPPRDWNDPREPQEEKGRQQRIHRFHALDPAVSVSEPARSQSRMSASLGSALIPGSVGSPIGTSSRPLSWGGIRPRRWFLALAPTSRLFVCMSTGSSCARFALICSRRRTLPVCRLLNPICDMHFSIISSFKGHTRRGGALGSAAFFLGMLVCGGCSAYRVPWWEAPSVSWRGDRGRCGVYICPRLSGLNSLLSLHNSLVVFILSSFGLTESPPSP